MLKANEFTREFPSGMSIKSYDTNQLQSNDPIEDIRNEAYCIHNKGEKEIYLYMYLWK